MDRLWIIATTYFLCGLMEVFCGALRALDRSVTAMIISLVGACGLRIVWIQTVFRWFPSPQTVYISYPVTWIVTLLLLMTFVIIVSKKLIRQQEREMLSE